MVRKAAVQAKAEWTPPPEPSEMSDTLDSGEPDLGELDSTLDSTEALADEPADDDLEVEAAVTDNVGEQSIEINVENLIAELEAETQKDKAPDVRCARRKLEDYLERKRIAQEIEDFEDFEVEQ
jgi:hypothetical protein